MSTAADIDYWSARLREATARRETRKAEKIRAILAPLKEKRVMEREKERAMPRRGALLGTYGQRRPDSPEDTCPTCSRGISQSGFGMHFRHMDSQARQSYRRAVGKRLDAIDKELDDRRSFPDHWERSTNADNISSLEGEKLRLEQRLVQMEPPRSSG